MLKYRFNKGTNGQIAANKTLTYCGGSGDEMIYSDLGNDENRKAFHREYMEYGIAEQGGLLGIYDDTGNLFAWFPDTSQGMEDALAYIRFCEYDDRAEDWKSFLDSILLG